MEAILKKLTRQYRAIVGRCPCAVDRRVINSNRDRGRDVVRDESLDVGTRLINQLSADDRRSTDSFRDNGKRIKALISIGTRASLWQLSSVESKPASHGRIKTGHFFE